jgi:hypothetical protein
MSEIQWFRVNNTFVADFRMDDNRAKNMKDRSIRRPRSHRLKITRSHV